MYAAVNGKCDVVTELISLGADVDIQTNAVSHFLCLIMTLANGSEPPECLSKLFIQLPHLYLWHTFLMGHID